MDRRICVYPAGETDFSGNGLGCIAPTSCHVHWEENGEYSLEIEHPIDSYGKYLRLCAYDRTVVVPVPESPSMQIRMVEGTKAVEIYKITGGRVRLRSGAGTSQKTLKIYRRNTQMTLIAKTNSSWYEVTAPDGLHGYMSTKYLQKTGDSTAAAVVTEIRRDVPMRPQPFDVYAWDPGVRSVSARARHVFYRLADNMVCGPLKIENKTAQQALDAVFAAAENQDHGFNWHCEDTEALSLENEIEGKNLVDVILGDGGLCDRYGLRLLVDWFDIFLVKDIGMNRGVQIRYGKNLEKMSSGFDVSNVATRVIPVGQTKDGKLLYLGTGSERYLLSNHESLYARPRYAYLKVSDARVGNKVDGKTLSKTQALQRMREAAQAELDGGCDLPDCSITATMVRLRNDPAYAQYAALETVCPGDTLGMFVPNFGLVLNMRVSAYDFEALRQEYDEITLGTPQANTARTGISARQLGGRSVSASKLAYGCVGASALAEDVIDARHLQADSINARAIQAESVTTEKLAAETVTAEKLAAGSVTAEKIAAGAVDAISINAVKARLAEITAKDIETDELAAELARLTVLICGSAAFDAATIKHLVAQAMNLEYGVAGQVFIKNLAVEYAQMVGATIGNLCIKASDGKYYLLDVGADGRVTAAETTVSDGEIEAGQTSGGSAIVETNITAASLTTTNLLATYALINKIDAARIDVDELVARRTFTDALYTSKIYGGKSLELIVGDVSKAQTAANNAQTAADKAQSDIDGMAIGGRNLVLKSDAEKGPARNNEYYIAANRFIAGEYYACSVEMKSPNENSVDVYINDDSGAGRIGILFSQWRGVKLTPDWVRYSFVYKADKDYDYPGKGHIVLHVYGMAAGAADISVRRVKVEKGNKATDWTAAPEDTDGKIDNAQTAADNAQTTANGAQTAADNAQTAADNAQTTANGAKTAADNAQSTADNAQTTADNAQTAANGAQTAADNAQTAADGAQASADNAQNTASAARTATEQLQVSVEGVLEQTVDGVRIGKRINGQTAPNSLFAGPDGIDVCVENRAVSSFRSDYIKLLGMQIRVPEGIGGLIISSYAPEP